jgi:hypothetical protein
MIEFFALIFNLFVRSHHSHIRTIITTDIGCSGGPVDARRNDKSSIRRKVCTSRNAKTFRDDFDSQMDGLSLYGLLF